METGPTGYSDFAPARSRLAEELLEALGEAPKRIPSKLLYDARGSQLFEQICELEEYYLTRTELSIMREYAPAMADALGARSLLVEFGSGAGTKTRLLLDALEEPTGYVPIDISASALAQSAEQLERRYPDLEILPVCADYTGEYRIPEAPRAHDRISVYFPGSTLGNFTRPEARHFLEHVAKLSGAGGGMLVGIDLDKDPRILELAYDDPGGVTAAFELNVLERLNRDFDADFRLAEEDRDVPREPRAAAGPGRRTDGRARRARAAAGRVRPQVHARELRAADWRGRIRRGARLDRPRAPLQRAVPGRSLGGRRRRRAAVACVERPLRYLELLKISLRASAPRAVGQYRAAEAFFHAELAGRAATSAPVCGLVELPTRSMLCRSEPRQRRGSVHSACTLLCLCVFAAAFNYQFI
jgi:dimethylhistidine N-methyltransferase